MSLSASAGLFLAGKTNVSPQALQKNAESNVFNQPVQTENKKEISNPFAQHVEENKKPVNPFYLSQKEIREKMAALSAPYNQGAEAAGTLAYRSASPEAAGTLAYSTSGAEAAGTVASAGSASSMSCVA